MRMYRRPTMEIIRIGNEGILAAWSAKDEYNEGDVSYSKGQRFQMEEEE